AMTANQSAGRCNDPQVGGTEITAEDDSTGERSVFVAVVAVVAVIVAGFVAVAIRSDAGREATPTESPPAPTTIENRDNGG
ncbi:MAG: hypothetical protein ACR2QO_05850, partial [Acidimicrobiales bacterium]